MKRCPSNSCPRPHHSAAFADAFPAAGALTFIVEAVHLVDGRRLVVAPEQKKVVGVLDLVAHEQADCLQAPLAPVHVVPEGGQEWK